MNKTVKEIFSKAFGEVPEGATCHFSSSWTTEGGKMSGASYKFHAGVKVTNRFDDEWNQHVWKRFPCEYFVSPDISDRPASAFRGFFGAEYDNCLDAEGEK